MAGSEKLGGARDSITLPTGAEKLGAAPADEMDACTRLGVRASVVRPTGAGKLGGALAEGEGQVDQPGQMERCYK